MLVTYMLSATLMLTKQKFSFAFELVVSTPKSLSLRLSRLVIVGARLSKILFCVCLRRYVRDGCDGLRKWDAVRT